MCSFIRPKEREFSIIRKNILEKLNRYFETWVQGHFSYPSYCFREEEKNYLNFLNFVKDNPSCFARENLLGHITASAIIIDYSFENILLTHHRKLNKWLQLGGHSDGDPDTEAVAMREAKEESGLEDLVFLTWGQGGEILDLDIHLIPQNKKELNYCQ